VIVTQTWAILVDAYRELNAKRLFWITMGLSLLVVLAFAAIGLNEKGFAILFWTIPNETMNSKVFAPADFYKLAYVGLGIQFWLSFIAMILALISTASMIPDMLASGSIELVLARPISRARLFLTKCVAGLLFAFLQVLVFSTASFLVIGLRGGTWEPGLFLAVPIVTLMFSYLFGACVLFGVLTRSAIASLLMTMLVWFFSFALNSTESVLLMQKLSSELSVERHTQVIAETRVKVADLEAELAALEEKIKAGTLAEDDPDVIKLRSRISTGHAYVARIEKDLPDQEQSVRSFTRWHGVFYPVKVMLPKTTETSDLLSRWLINAANLPKGPESDTPKDSELSEVFGTDGDASAKAENAKKRPIAVRVSPKESGELLKQALEKRSVAWIVGTSMGFVGVCVGIATFLFSRRDF